MYNKRKRREGLLADMEPGLKTKRLRIDGMTCAACQNKIERKLRRTAGIASAEADCGAGTAVVAYDADVIAMREIEALIEGLGYRVVQGDRPAPSGRRAVGILLLVLAAFMLFRRFGPATVFNLFPTAEVGMGYGLLFLIGLLTSVHCIAMCGGINLSQCIPQSETSGGGKWAALRPSLLYNLGRVLSYTAIGAVVGALGSALTLTGALRGLVQLIAGAFMIVMGINMLGIFPQLRRLAPRLPQIFARRIDAEKENAKSPLIVGLLNGFMPCGPLQAMQLYALSAGSPAAGALSMLLFSLGTVPLPFGFGALSSVLGRRFTRRVMTVGAALVVFLGLSMFSQGLALSSLSPGFLSPGPALTGSTEVAAPRTEDGYQIVTGTLQPGRYPAITVRAGIPVKWTIDAPQGSINGCNNRIIIPAFGIEHKFTTGANLIEFMPTETGSFPYSCWMGMIRSTITVVDED
jgi:sulfite exporter TauE/SafE/copper chaperone CopZ